MKNHTWPEAAVTGFVTGLLAGGAAGLLLAPASGRMTRARIKQRLREAAESAREIEERMNYRLRETADSARGLKERLRRGLRPATARILGRAS
jgi:gas vesicle protein